MLNLLTQLRPHGFNVRRLRESDLLQICESERIIVQEDRVATSFYLNVDGKGIITIPDTFQGLKREFALAHEICHHIVHVGDDTQKAFFLGVEQTKEETEADASACMALIPLADIYAPQILDEYPLNLAREIAIERQRLHFLYGE